MKFFLARQKLSKRKDDDRSREVESRQSKVQSLYQRKIAVSSLSDVSKKEKNAERTRLLDLAMDWNCINTARELIFQNSLDNILVFNMFISFLFEIHVIYTFRIKTMLLRKLYKEIYRHLLMNFSN